MTTSEQIGVVFIHGFLSKPKTWRHFERLIVEDSGLPFVNPLMFPYASPLFSLNPLRRIPSYEDAADGLKVYLEARAAEFGSLVLVSHSQGGLIVQRYLHRMLGEGRGEDLRRIRQI